MSRSAGATARADLLPRARGPADGAARDRRAAAPADHRQRPGARRRARDRARGGATRARPAGRHDGRRQRRRPALHDERPAAAAPVRRRRTCRSRRGPPGALFGSVVRATEIHGEAGIGGTTCRRRPSELAPRGRGRPHRRDPALASRAGRHRADRPADEHRAAAPAPPGARAADRPPLPHGRLDRRRQHHGLGRVQHLRRPGGCGDRLRVRPADHDDGPRRDPPGGASYPRRSSDFAVDRHARPAPSRPSSSTTRSRARGSGTARRGCRSTTRSPWPTSRSRTSSRSPSTTSRSTPATARRAAGRCATGSRCGSREQGRVPNAQVGIRIDRDRFEDLLVDAYGRLP